MINYILKLNPQTQNELAQAKRKLASFFNIPAPTNSALIKEYRDYIKKSKEEPNHKFLALLKRRQVRTGSGVAPVAILTKPYPCPGKCFYCPNEKGMPKSYLSNEPAVMRAILNKFDPYKQIHTRLSALEANGHPTDKIEIIIMGGTWSYLPLNYQLNYIIKCFEACNEFAYSPLSQRGVRGDFSMRQSFNTCQLPLIPSGKIQKWQILQRLQKQNETAKHRIVGLTLETRPDYITEKEIQMMREYGCTRVELGAQAIDDKILALNRRGHGVKEIINATRLLREAGFKICYHMMVNLPSSTPRKDLKMFKELFSNPDYQPDMIKIYPCVITKNAPLYKWYKQKKYIPYTETQLTNLLIKIKQIVPPYVRIIRVIRDIPTTSIIAGNKVSNLREKIQRIMEQKKTKCQCIRCREIKTSKIKNSSLIIRKYSAANGKEYFLSYEDKKQNKIIAFLRLRLPCYSPLFQRGGRGDFSKHIISSTPLNSPQNTVPATSAIIREAHTYGPALQIGEKNKKASQHTGLGKKLILEAEKIAKKNGYKKMAVISGVGVRNYYRKLGYKLKDTYMVKNIV